MQVAKISHPKSPRSELYSNIAPFSTSQPDPTNSQFFLCFSSSCIRPKKVFKQTPKHIIYYIYIYILRSYEILTLALHLTEPTPPSAPGSELDALPILRGDHKGEGPRRPARLRPRAVGVAPFGHGGMGKQEGRRSLLLSTGFFLDVERHMPEELLT